MAITYDKIATVTVTGATAANIEFTSIPQTYTDLLLKVSLRDNRTDSPVTDTLVTFNNSTSGYSVRGVYGTGSIADDVVSLSRTDLAGTYENTSQSGNDSVFSNSEYYIANYKTSNTKPVIIDGVTEKNVTSDIYMSLITGVWVNSSAITSIKLVPMFSLLFVTNSTATLYGIKNS